MRVQVPPRPLSDEEKPILAYVIGVALGDGNLSRPNHRVTRLRISCDSKYPEIANEMMAALRVLLPKNRVSVASKYSPGCFDISVYSRQLDAWMPWVAGKGSKAVQRARVPEWIKLDEQYSKECLRGLIQTDGCIYTDRGYQMVNFVNNTRELAEDAYHMLLDLGFTPNVHVLNLDDKRRKYNVRVSRNAHHLIEILNLYKK